MLRREQFLPFSSRGEKQKRITGTNIGLSEKLRKKEQGMNVAQWVQSNLRLRFRSDAIPFARGGMMLQKSFCFLLEKPCYLLTCGDRHIFPLLRQRSFLWQPSWLAATLGVSFFCRLHRPPRFHRPPCRRKPFYSAPRYLLTPPLLRDHPHALVHLVRKVARLCIDVWTWCRRVASLPARMPRPTRASVLPFPSSLSAR